MNFTEERLLEVALGAVLSDGLSAEVGVKGSNEDGVEGEARELPMVGVYVERKDEDVNLTSSEGREASNMEVRFVCRVDAAPAGSAQAAEVLMRQVRDLILTADGSFFDAFEAVDAVIFAGTERGFEGTTRVGTLVFTLVSLVGPDAGPLLQVLPGTGLVSTGEAGGPFSPGNKVYTLTNLGETSLEFEVAVDEDWLTLSVESGTIAGGASTTVTVSLNAEAADLGNGAYFGTVTFRNLTGYESISRGVGLVVGVTGGGESMNQQNGNFSIPNGVSTFDITFAVEFADVPSFADVNIAPASGQAAIGVHSITRAADKLTVVLDAATPTTGYVANWFAFLE